jgi:hypothetical protein
VAALYELSRAPAEAVDAAITAHRITPEMTAKDARAAVAQTTNAKPSERSSSAWQALLHRTRRFAAAELERPDADAYLVGHALRAIAHEILTPLPRPQCADLERKYFEVSAELDAEFRDPWGLLMNGVALRDWIRGEGGLRRSRDYPDVKPIAPGKLAYDELVQMFVARFHTGSTKTERAMMKTLAHSPKRSSLLSPAVRAKRLRDLLDGRALKTGLVRRYYAVSPSPPTDPDDLSDDFLDAREQVLERMRELADRHRGELAPQDTMPDDQAPPEREIRHWMPAPQGMLRDDEDDRPALRPIERLDDQEAGDSLFPLPR